MVNPLTSRRRRLAAASAAAAALAVAAPAFGSEALAASGGHGASRYAPAPPYAPIPPYGTGELAGFYTELAASGTAMPPGVANRPCQPSPAHPYPVVLVHGTFANADFSWQTIGPTLSDAGYCVFALNYGATELTTMSGGHMFAADYVERSAAQLQAFIAGTVLPDTYEPAGNQAGYRAGSHPAQVDMVGHSQGGMMPRYLIDSTGNATYPGLGKASEVHMLIGLAPSNHGSTLEGIATLGEAVAAAFGQPQSPYSYGNASGQCGACAEQEVGSPFLQALDAHPDPSSVQMYVIESNHDEVVTPYSSAFLPAGRNVSNTLLQSQCPTDATEHLGIIYDPVAIADVVAALADNGRTVRSLPAPVCPAAVPPVISG